MLTQKSIVITGASTGIGAACGLHLNRLGFHVFAGVRRPEAGEALQQQASGRLTPVFIDVTDPGSIAAAADMVAAAVGETGLAGLVNNAGIARGGPLEFLPSAELQRQLEVNVIGQVAVSQAFLPFLRRSRGRIVNIGSISGRIAMPFLGPYAASKFALAALTDSLRAELRPWGIEVCLVEPGPVATPIWDKSLAAADQMVQKLPPQALALYGPAFARMRESLQHSSRIAIPPAAVAKVVAHALTAPRPKTRYLVGRWVWLAALFAKFAPDRLRDWVITR